MRQVVKSVVKNLMIKFLSVACRNDGPKVVYYHDVGKKYTSMGTDIDLFCRHVAAARAIGFEFKDTIANLTIPRYILLCFDDGFRGIWNERTYFVSAGLHPTVFIAVDLVGKPGYLTWQEIGNLQKMGFCFQGHTWSHRPLTHVHPREWKHELDDSRQELSSRLGQPVDSLCFPCGAFSSAIVDKALEAGYKYLFSSYPGCVNLAAKIIPRNLVQSVSPTCFKDILHGALCPLKKHYLRQQFLGGPK